MYTAPIPAVLSDMHELPAILTLRPSRELSASATALEPGAAATPQIKALPSQSQQPQEQLHQKQRPTSSTSSQNSHISISSSHASEKAARSLLGPLTVEKVTSGASGRSTPIAGSRESDHQRSVVLVGNTVEERAANYVQGLHSPVVEDTLSDIEEAISEIHKNRESRTNKIIQDHNQRHSNVMPSALVSRVSNNLPTMSELHDSSSEYSIRVDQPAQEISSDMEDGEEKLPIQGYQEDDVPFTRADVQKWLPSDVSRYLQSRHIALTTCVKFEEQEVSGAILLQLEMSHLKELELGSFGKRFEVWKEIEYLIRNLKSSKTKTQGGNSVRSSNGCFANNPGRRKRSSTVGSVLPHIPSQHDQPASQQHSIDISEANQSKGLSQSQTATTTESSIASPTFEIFEAPRSPPLSPRRSNSSRRYTMQSTKRSSIQESPATALNVALATGTAILSAGSIDNGGNKVHRREGSFERDWTLTDDGNPPPLPPRPATATGMRDTSSSKHKTSASTGTGDSALTTDSGFSGSQPETPNKATERSYFSSGESMPRERKVLHKKNGASHGRSSSYTEEQKLRSFTAHRHSRVASAESATPYSRKLTPSLSLSAAHAYYKEKHKRKSASFSGTSDLSLDIDTPRLSPAPPTKGTGAQRRVADDSIIGRAISPTIITSAPFAGGRSISETLATSPQATETPTFAGAPSVGSAEESAASLNAAVDLESISPGRIIKADRRQSSASKRIRGVASGSGLRQKSKKQTTAWEKGLRVITPIEAALESDYSGWMKKRGSSGVSSWKPRFFVLTGRRLSYFYSDADTKERGLIDITSHKVLPATEDKLIGLHAAFDAVISPVVSPKPGPNSPLYQNMDSPDPSSPDKAKHPRKSEQFAEGKVGKEKEKVGRRDKAEKKEKMDRKEKSEKDKGWFTFKLVPPAPGAAKGVTFTPPRLHYFATETRDEGKRWMAAIMKATIDRDETKPVITSYSAKTISLARARMLKARPPELGQHANGLAILGLEEAEDDADVEDEEGSKIEVEENTNPHTYHAEDKAENSVKIAAEGIMEVDANDQLKKTDRHPELQVAAFGVVG